MQKHTEDNVKTHCTQIVKVIGLFILFPFLFVPSVHMNIYI